MSRYHNNMCHIRCLVTLNCNAKLIISYILRTSITSYDFTLHSFFFYHRPRTKSRAKREENKRKTNQDQ